jgi:pyruvate dehydrogenase E2 component (dihydrolipoamide acetyltransferase)
MAQEIVMPKLGNTVESVIIVEWRKEVGDSIAVGEAICEVETDKATVEVEAEIAGTLLAKLYDVDDDVPVLIPFAIVGEAGEDVSGMLTSAAPASDTSSSSEEAASAASAPAPQPEAVPVSAAQSAPAAAPAGGSSTGISPRARNLASSSGLQGLPAAGTGPGGRIIERDVQAALEGKAPLTPAAVAVGGTAPALGSGIGGRVLASDMGSAPAAGISAPAEFPGPVETLPVKGIRKLVAQRMHASLAETAQLTLNASTSAASLLSWRAAYKASPEAFGLSKVSINDLIMFTVARLLQRYPDMNATFHGNEIRQYRHVHLGFAVDTPKGLMVPVIRFADQLSLSQLSAETRRLAGACRDGSINPDELSGGTFTITNLGSFGIESFTPVINTPEVAILGGNPIYNYPVETPEGLAIEKRMGLSLTIDHQAVDGAPGARFLKDLSALLGNLELAAAL